RIGVQPALAGEALRVGLVRLLVLPFGLLLALVLEHALAAASRLGQTRDEDGERERRQREDDERGTPRRGCDVARHGEAESGAEELAGEDVAVDAPSLPAAEIVADERRD